MNRRRPQEPAYSVGGSASSSGGYSQSPSFQQGGTGSNYSGSGSSYANEAQGVFGGGAAATGAAATAAAAPLQVPAGFDTEAFLRSSKVYFVRLQAAWTSNRHPRVHDAGNVRRDQDRPRFARQ